MNNTRLKTHYMYFIPITLLQVLSTGLMMILFSVQDYAAFTLYLTNLNMFIFTTLGIHSGFIVLNRGKRYEDINDARSLHKGFGLLQIGLGLLLVLILNLIGFNFATITAISIALTSIYQLNKSLFLATNDAHILNISTLCFRSIFLIDALSYLVISDFKSILLLDISLRAIHVLIFSLVVYFKYPKSKGTKCRRFEPLNKYASSGFVLLLSNWFFSFSIMFDKYALASDLEKLGYYSFALSVVLLFRVLLIPLNDVLFVKIDKDMTSDQINAIFKKIQYFSLPLLLVLFTIITITIRHLPFMNKYIPALPALAILLLVIPITIPLEAILLNLNRISKSSTYLLKALISCLIFFSLLFGYSHLVTNINLALYSLVVLFAYLLSLTTFAIGIVNKKVLLNILSRYLILIVIYSSIIFVFN